MMDQNIWAILLMKFSTTSVNCFQIIKFANSAILKLNIALGGAAFCSLFCLCIGILKYGHFLWWIIFQLGSSSIKLWGFALICHKTRQKPFIKNDAFPLIKAEVDEYHSPPNLFKVKSGN